MNKVLLSFMLFFLSTFLMVHAAETAKISVDNAARIMQSDPENVVIVDVRTPLEYKEDHLQNALNINLYNPDFDEQIRKLPIDKPVLVYCRTGMRSARAAEKLRAAGFAKVLDMDGGILQWQRNGLPTVNDSRESAATGTDE